MANRLTPFRVPNFAGGYNSYTASKSNIEDNEIPLGRNTELDDNGSMSKSSGSAQFGGQLSSGHSVTGLGNLKNTSFNVVIGSSNVSWYKVDGTAGTSTALTGKTFASDLDTDFCQALDKLYGANGTDNLCYTSNGTTVTEITSNGNVGRWPNYFNQRLYMTSTAYPDRIYYSNPYSIDLSANPPTLTGFADANMFNTDLTSTPKKNAGFIILKPGGGVEITRLVSKGDYLYAYTKRDGRWKVGTVAAANADGSIAHTVTQDSPAANSVAGRSVVTNQNDDWWYNDGYYSYGEVSTYQSPRQSTQSGRIRSELNSIAATGKTKVAAVPFKEKVIIAYQVGTYNDRIVKFDNRTNAWSTPVTGINASCFLEYLDSNGVRRLLAGSSYSSSSYVYEIETGTNYAGTAVDAYFETKSFDCGRPGLIKRFAFIDVFYSLLLGQISYSVYADEDTLIATDSVQVGSSATTTSGVGSKIVGTFLVGQEFSAGSTPSTATNGTLRIDTGFEAGKNFSVRFSNSRSGEQYKIDSLVAYYQEGSIYEQ